MKRRLVFRRAARMEFDEATDWYDRQQSGLGEAFIEHVQATLDRIRLSPGQFPIVFGVVRQALVERFPYSVLFLANPKQITVIAVFHHRRDPLVWQSRV